MPVKIGLPYEWSPRAYQTPLWGALESGKKRAVCVWHRRAGKDMTALQWCACEAFRRKGLYWHLFPTYAEGKKAMWRGMDKSGREFLKAFPEPLIAKKREDDMTIELHGGSIYQVVGSDHIDRLMGANPVGVIVSEYSLQNPAAWDLILPILVENDGWAIFVYTPRGRNHGYNLYNRARKLDDWFCQKLTIDDTTLPDGSPVVTHEKVERTIAGGMSKVLAEQEFWCSFDAPLEGAYYLEQIEWMHENKHIGQVPHDPAFPVITGWDIGWGDSTAIWFAQQIGPALRVIDYEEHSGQPVDFYAKLLREKKDYTYGDCILPHDAAHHSVLAEDTFSAQLESHGFRTRTNLKYSLTDQIAAVRRQLRMTYMDEDEDSCERGLTALGEYTKKPIDGVVGPLGEKLYRDEALHNWASHGASAFATLVLGLQMVDDGGFQQPSTKYIV